MAETYTVTRLEHPTDDQIDAIVSLCLRAYASDIAIKVMTGNNKSLYDPLFRSMVRAGALDGVIYVSTTLSGDIVGAGLWYAPGHSLWSSEKQRNEGFTHFMSLIDEETRNWWLTTYQSEPKAFLEKVLGPKGAFNSWYASMIAVDPAYQRRGILTQFVDTVYQEAKNSNNILSLCAANDLNVTIYNKLGFVTKGRTALAAPHGIALPVICLAKYPTQT